MTTFASTRYNSELQSAKGESPWQIRLQVGFGSLFVFLLTLSFKSYFYYIPRFSPHYYVIPALQYFATLGWIAMIIGPNVFFWNAYTWNSRKSRLLLISALLWPVSIFLIKVVELIQFHNAYMHYWVSYPIFIAMDVALPLFYVLLWRGITPKRS